MADDYFPNQSFRFSNPLCSKSLHYRWSDTSEEACDWQNKMLLVALVSSQEETEELKKRVAVLECQLRKTESAKKGFEMSTGKLLSFVEVKSQTRTLIWAFILYFSSYQQISRSDSKQLWLYLVAGVVCESQPDGSSCCSKHRCTISSWLFDQNYSEQLI